MAAQKTLYPNALRALIKRSGYTFGELSKETGIPERTLFDWASGNRVILRADRETLAHFIGCTVEELAPGMAATHLVQSGYKQVDELEQGRENMNTTRRLLLQTLGGIALFASSHDILHPEAWERLFSASTNPHSMDEETLRRFGQIINWCWDQSSGSGLRTVEQLLPTFLPHLASFALYPSGYQEEAAHLVSQGYQLTYVIATQHEDFTTALTACKQARQYGQLSHDPNMEALALIRQGVSFLYKKRPHQTLRAYQEALSLEKALSPLLRTRLHAALAEVHGKLQHEQEALTHIGLAHDSFPDKPEHDPASPYVHFDRSSIYLHQGLALLDLNQPADATRTLEQIDGLKPKMPISERNRSDVLNQQALAAGQQHDLEAFSAYLENAVASARSIGSELRVSEAWDVYTRISPQWRHETRIQAIVSVFA
jgi:tetratricopeptide (TPR) repeat protein